MVPRIRIEISQADRGFVVRTDVETAEETKSELFLFEGQFDSRNLTDRVRRHVTGLLREWFPDGRTAAASSD